MVYGGNTKQDGTPTPENEVEVKVVTGEVNVKVENANILDRTTCVENNALAWATGSTFSETNSLASDYIKVINGEQIAINYKAQILFYDKSKVYLGALLPGGINIAKQSGEVFNIFTVPTNSEISYVRLGFRPQNNNSTNMVEANIIVNKGTTASPYTPHQEQNYTLNLGKNLFDGELEIGDINTTTGENQTNAKDSYARTKEYIEVAPNTTFAFQYIRVDEGSPQIVIYEYDINKNFIKFTAYSLSQTTHLFSSTTKYVRVRYLGGVYSTLSSYDKIQIEKGTTATTYAPYFEPIELCKIGDYQDYFYKENGKHYVHKEIGKVVLDGSESGWDANSSYTLFNLSNIFNGTYLVQNAFSNYFINVVDENITGGGSANQLLSDNQFSFRWGTTKDRIYIKTSLFNSIPDFKTWLSTHNTEVYYVLANPIEEEITDETLIAQLEAIYNMRTYQGTTHIDSDNEVPPILTVEYFKDFNVVNDRLDALEARLALLE